MKPGQRSYLPGHPWEIGFVLATCRQPSLKRLFEVTVERPVNTRGPLLRLRVEWRKPAWWPR